MPDDLAEYRRKRDPGATPEPRGDRAAEAGPAGGQPRFVVQEHRARNLHWDLRLEREGALVSWALPKGIPTHPDRNHLAVRVEDHPLEYLTFAGEIPAGEYGAGTVQIWDSGTYETEKFRPGEVIVTFRGERLRGRYVLFQTGGRNWMIHRMDPPEDPAEEPMPERVEPMLARLSELPADDSGWAFEVKWDGMRALVFSDAGHVRIQSRRLEDITQRFPELRRIGRALGSHRAVLDGEIVALRDDGTADFGRLQGRMHIASEAAARRRAAETPVVFMAFDLLYLDGHSTMALAYEQRRSLLERLELDGPAWRTPAHHVGDGAEMLRAARERGVEGVVAKRLGSPYRPGSRTRDWLKVKNAWSQELVVGGWLPGKGARRASLGSLAVGFYDRTPEEAREAGKPQRLRYAGSVGSGLSDADLAELGRRLAPLRRDESPFTGRQPPRAVVFVEPLLVIEAAFREWTRAHSVRQASFKGIRDDKDPRDVIFEARESGADA